MRESEKGKVLKDWENFIFESEVKPEGMDLIEGKSRGFWKRIKDFLGRLF